MKDAPFVYVVVVVVVRVVVVRVVIVRVVVVVVGRVVVVAVCGSMDGSTEDTKRRKARSVFRIGGCAVRAHARAY